MPFDDIMNTMLSPTDAGIVAHITGSYGEQRGNSTHGGVDFNYVGGQTGVNLEHPTVHAPIGGVVTSVGGNYNRVVITDSDGNTHEILKVLPKIKTGNRVV